jgi:hypothetical protein
VQLSSNPSALDAKLPLSAAAFSLESLQAARPLGFLPIALLSCKILLELKLWLMPQRGKHAERAGKQERRHDGQTV